MSDYTPAHCAAFDAYRAKGYRLDGLSDTQLDALLEDKHFVDEIARWRRKAVAPPSPQPAPVPTTAVVTHTFLHKTLDAVATTLAKLVKEQVLPLKAEVKTLQAEIAALKADHAALDAKALKGGAAWQRGVTYAVNDCVQHDGSLWKCLELHVSGASFSHECFLLQIKRGRDGKDAR